MGNEILYVGLFLVGWVLGLMSGVAHSEKDCVQEFESWTGEWGTQKRKCKKCGLIQERYIKSVNAKPWRKK